MGKIILNYKLLALIIVVVGGGLQPAHSQMRSARKIELVGAATMLTEFADLAIAQFPNPKDAENEVVNQVKTNSFLRDHKARMTVLNENTTARFRITLESLSKEQCTDFVGVAAGNPNMFSGVEVNGTPVKGYSVAACVKNSSVSLLRV